MASSISLLCGTTCSYVRACRSLSAKVHTEEVISIHTCCLCVYGAGGVWGGVWWGVVGCGGTGGGVVWWGGVGREGVGWGGVIH